MQRLLYIQFTDPAAYPSLEHSAKLFVKRGWDVIFLGVETVHQFEFSLAQGIKARRLKFVKGGLAQKVQYLMFFLWAFAWTVRWRPKWVYASDQMACPIAWWLRKLTGVRVLYHEHDAPDCETIRNWFTKHLMYYRSALGRDAELCVIPQQERLRKFITETKRQKPTYCVWNCPSLEECTKNVSAPDCGSTVNGQPLIGYYHGSINSARLPIQLVEAASRLGGGVRLRIVGYETLGSIGYMRRMEEEAKAHGAIDLIECLGTMSRRSDIMEAALGADIGIALMPSRSNDLNMQSMVGASNKPFDYMASGLPLLVTASTEWIETFVKPGYARACDPEDPASIEAELQWYRAHPEERKKMGLRGRERIRQEWNYDLMFGPVLSEMESH